MPARAALQSLLEQDPILGEDIGVEAVYPTNAVDTPAEQLFIVIRWDPTTMAFKQVGADRCSIWVHDTQRDYGRITDALQRLKELLPATVHRAGEDGWTLTTAEWLGEGPDLFDGGYNTVTRYADFNVVSRYTAP
jgi:hypothetical protein